MTRIMGRKVDREGIQVYFWNGCGNEYTRDAVFDGAEQAKEYGEEAMSRMRKFVTHFLLIDVKSGRRVERIERVHHD